MHVLKAKPKHFKLKTTVGFFPNCNPPLLGQQNSHPNVDSSQTSDGTRFVLFYTEQRIASS